MSTPSQPLHQQQQQQQQQQASALNSSPDRTSAAATFDSATPSYRNAALPTSRLPPADDTRSVVANGTGSHGMGPQVGTVAQRSSALAVDIEVSASTQSISDPQRHRLTSQQKHQQQPLAPLQRCAACGREIADRFLLHAIDRYWHNECLRCTACQAPLAELGSTCFTRGGMTLCRPDYIRLFGTSGTCRACRQSIPPNEFVMKTYQDGSVYHVSCFACITCHVRLVPGDRYGLINGRLVCEQDYVKAVKNQLQCQSQLQQPTTAVSAAAPSQPPPTHQQQQHHHQSQQQQTALQQLTNQRADAATGQLNRGVPTAAT